MMMNERPFLPELTKIPQYGHPVELPRPERIPEGYILERPFSSDLGEDTGS